MHRVECEWDGRTLLLETGKVARQADSSVWVRYGGTIVLVALTANRDEAQARDYLPLTINYQEMSYAGGSIPGSFFRREGRPGEREIITSRLIDRSLRPLFPKNYRWDTQVVATVLSFDQENMPDIPALVGASAVLGLSDLPFPRILAGIRIGRKDGRFLINPVLEDIRAGDMDLVVSGDEQGIVMVEGSCRTVPEEDVLAALSLAREKLLPAVELQKQLVGAAGRAKMEWVEEKVDESCLERISTKVGEPLRKALCLDEKLERNRERKRIRDEYIAGEVPGGDTDPEAVKERKKWEEAFAAWEKREMRDMARTQGRRIDGRDFRSIRAISCETGILPRVHGSALFTRGETQAIVSVTLGSGEDEQLIEVLEGVSYRKFMLHYNFPPYSVGEARPLRAPGRREIGHGVLASRAIQSVLPNPEDFPYTIRVVSEIIESNGSSSMATVCGTSLALMDAGVPVSDAVAGIAMGLMKEQEEFIVLTDILGDEDHLGDMDLKVAGTAAGVCALQMDIKISGLTSEVFSRALAQAREARLKILGEMNAALSAPRQELSPYAPRVVYLMINPDKIKDLIGPAGKHIKRIVELTGAKIDVYDEGRVNVFSADPQAMDKALEIIKELTQTAEIGKVYLGKVKKVVDFGAFLEILPGTEGLVHISQMSPGRVERVTDVMREGDEVVVKVLDIDSEGKIRLSRKEAMSPEEAERELRSMRSSSRREGGGRNDRDNRDNRDRKTYSRRK